MAAYVVMQIDDLPSIDDEGVDWRPVQHYFGVTAFGINVYRATVAGVQLLGEHDESAGRHEEVYVVLDGRIHFTLDGESFDCGRGTIVAVQDPAVRRSATAGTEDAAVLAVGNRQAERFESTWQAHHFEGVPIHDA